LRTLGVEPALVAHDLHPDFHSTRFAAAFAARRGLPAIAVQHHHAHVAAVAAEHRLRAPLLGLALDGVGLGNDGGIWGGELLRVEAGWRNASPCARIGCRAAIAPRELWRMAASALFEMGCVAKSSGATPARRRDTGADACARLKLDDAERLFAQVAAKRPIPQTYVLIGRTYEGEAAILLQQLAEARGPVSELQGGYRIGADGTLDLLPLLAHLVAQEDAGYGAAVFHATLAAALAAWVRAASERTGVRSIALGGGCFVNRILAANLRQRLEAAGLAVFEARQAPPGDGAGAGRRRWRWPGERLSMCLAIPALVVEPPGRRCHHRRRRHREAACRSPPCPKRRSAIM
jgi:hydrogenase maturation protein HypF